MELLLDFSDGFRFLHARQIDCFAPVYLDELDPAVPAPVFLLVADNSHEFIPRNPVNMAAYAVWLAGHHRFKSKGDLLDSRMEKPEKPLRGP